MRRQVLVQPLDLIERDIGPGRIVRIGQEHHFSLRRHRLEHGVDIDGVIRFWRHDRLGAGPECRDRIDQEAVGGVDGLVAVGEVGACNQVEQVVGARSANDARRVETEGGPERLAQFGGRTVRVVLQVLADRAIGGNGFRARPQR